MELDQKGLVRLVVGLTHERVELREQCLRALVNASVDDKWKLELANSPTALRNIVRLVEPSRKLFERATSVQLLSNICLKSVETRTAVCAAGPLPHIKDLFDLALSTENYDAVEKILWLLTNLSTDHPENRKAIGCTTGLSAYLAQCMHVDRDALKRSGKDVSYLSVNDLAHPQSVVVQACAALTNCCYDVAFQGQVCGIPGFVESVVAIQCCTEPKVQRAASNVLLMLLARDPSIVRQCVQCGAAKAVMHNMLSPDAVVVHRAAKCTYNLLTHQEHHQTLLNAHVVPLLLSKLPASPSSPTRSFHPSPLQKEVVSSLFMASTNPNVRQAIRDARGVPIVVGLLPSTDASLVMEAVQLVYNLTLEDSGTRLLKTTPVLRLLKALEVTHASSRTPLLDEVKSTMEELRLSFLELEKKRRCDSTIRSTVSSKRHPSPLGPSALTSHRMVHMDSGDVTSLEEMEALAFEGLNVQTELVSSASTPSSAGSTGSASSAGSTGSPSSTGPTGSPSSAGPTGSPSSAEPTGSASSAGPTGSASSVGPTGSASSVGPTSPSSAGSTGSASPSRSALGKSSLLAHKMGPSMGSSQRSSSMRESRNRDGARKRKDLKMAAPTRSRTSSNSQNISDLRKKFAAYQSAKHASEAHNRDVQAEPLPSHSSYTTSPSSSPSDLPILWSPPVDTIELVSITPPKKSPLAHSNTPPRPRNASHASPTPSGGTIKRPGSSDSAALESYFASVRPTPFDAIQARAHDTMNIDYADRLVDERKIQKEIREMQMEKEKAERAAKHARMMEEEKRVETEKMEKIRLQNNLRDMPPKVVEVEVLPIPRVEVEEKEVEWVKVVEKEVTPTIMHPTKDMMGIAVPEVVAGEPIGVKDEKEEDIPVKDEKEEDIPVKDEKKEDTPVDVKEEDDILVDVEKENDIPVDVEKKIDIPVDVEKEIDIPVDVKMEDDIPVDIIERDDVAVDANKEDDIPVSIEKVEDMPVDDEKEEEIVAEDAVETEEERQLRELKEWEEGIKRRRAKEKKEREEARASEIIHNQVAVIHEDAAIAPVHSPGLREQSGAANGVEAPNAQSNAISPIFAPVEEESPTPLPSSADEEVETEEQRQIRELKMWEEQIKRKRQEEVKLKANSAPVKEKSSGVLQVKVETSSQQFKFCANCGTRALQKDMVEALGGWWLPKCLPKSASDGAVESMMPPPAPSQPDLKAALNDDTPPRPPSPSFDDTPPRSPSPPSPSFDDTPPRPPSPERTVLRMSGRPSEKVDIRSLPRKANTVKEIESKNKQKQRAQDLHRELSQVAMGDMSGKRSRSATMAVVDSFTASNIHQTMVLQEIVDSEASYCAGLQALIHAFVRPLRVRNGDRKSAVCTREEERQLFSVAEDIYALNLQLLVGLRSAAHNPQVSVGELFVKFSPKFMLYSSYVNNYDQAIVLFEQLENNSEWKTWRKTQERTGGKALEGLLISPVQRVPRYKLLLEQLIKVTPEHDREYTALKEAHRHISKVTSYIDEANLIAQRLKRMTELQGRIEGLKDRNVLQKPGRLLLKDGTLFQKRKTNGSRYVHLIVFSDLLLVARPKRKGRLKFDKMLSLLDASLLDVPDTMTLKNAFTIFISNRTRTDAQCEVNTKASKKKKENGEITFFANSPEEKEAWVKCISEAGKTLKERTAKLDSKLRRLASKRSLSST